MPIELDVRQRLLWDVSPIGEKKLEVMYAGLMYAAACTMLPGVDKNAAYVQVFKWTSLLLSYFDTRMTDSLDLAQRYITTKFGNRTLAIIATRVLSIWLPKQSRTWRKLTDKQRGNLVYHLSGMVVVLSSIMAYENKTLHNLYDELFP